jgi:hypothetical protein
VKACEYPSSRVNPSRVNLAQGRARQEPLPRGPVLRRILLLLALVGLATGCAAARLPDATGPGPTQSTDWRIDTFSGQPTRQSL